MFNISQETPVISLKMYALTELRAQCMNLKKDSALVCTVNKQIAWVPTVQPDTTWKPAQVPTLFIRIVKSTFGGFKTPVTFAELDLARQDVLVLSSSCSPSPGIWLSAARSTWQGIYNTYTS